MKYLKLGSITTVDQEAGRRWNILPSAQKLGSSSTADQRSQADGRTLNFKFWSDVEHPPS
jgi:hypothetical protein